MKWSWNFLEIKRQAEREKDKTSNPNLPSGDWWKLITTARAYAVILEFDLKDLNRIEGSKFLKEGPTSFAKAVLMLSEIEPAPVGRVQQQS